jgi:hypothetical protein
MLIGNAQDTGTRLEISDYRESGCEMVEMFF